MKKRKVKSKLRAARGETDVYATFALMAREQTKNMQSQRDLARTELQGVQDVCERLQRERDLAKQDESDANNHSIELEDLLTEVRTRVWDDVHTPQQALYEVRQIVGRNPD